MGTHNEVCVLAGNQLGKTSGAAHFWVPALTGEYDKYPWYTGRRWNKPIVLLAASGTGELTRNGVQYHLLGDMEVEENTRVATLKGNGAIPGRCIYYITRKSKPPEAIDKAMIKHVSGGYSTIFFKAYEQGYMKFASQTADAVWLDEDPGAWDKRIFEECKRRLTQTNGCILMTMTPTEGMTDSVMKFYPQPDKPHRKLVMWGIDECTILTQEEKRRLIDECSDDERDCRLYGHPHQGSGKIFPYAKERYVRHVDLHRDIPRHALWWKSVDFGWEYTAVVWMAWSNDDRDIIWVFMDYQGQRLSIRENAMEVKAREQKLLGHNSNLITSYPHDGETTGDDSLKLKDHWKNNGIHMMDNWAGYVVDTVDHTGQYKERVTFKPESGIADIRERIEEGRLWIDPSCIMLIWQMQFYHKKDGKIVKKDDHCIDAMRVGIMAKDRGEPVYQMTTRKSRKKIYTDWDVMHTR